MKITNKHIFFWGGIFSNWYPSEFIASVNGKAIKFHNVEQYFMYMKAITFNDYDTAKLILKDGYDPSKAKQHGRAVKNYDDNTWDKIRYSVMLDGCQFKFSQNENMKEELLKEEYIGKGFVEGSPKDCIWGICAHYNDASDDESTWKGQNLLGKVLDEVRNNLLSLKENKQMKKGDVILYIDNLSINQATVTDVIKKEGCYKESITKVKLSNGKIVNASFEFFNDLNSAKNALKNKIDCKLSALISERDNIEKKIDKLNKLSNAFEL